MTTRCAIGLGSNVGHREQHLTSAMRSIESSVGAIVAQSSLWETEPIGGPEQGAYLNAVVVVDTELQADEVLDRLLSIEREHGRTRRERWGPRTLDLDVLLYGDAVVDRPGLSVPHPRLGERRFVIEPLLEAWPEARLPDGTPVESLRMSVAHQQVKRYGQQDVSVSGAAVFFTVIALVLAMWWLVDLVVK